MTKQSIKTEQDLRLKVVATFLREKRMSAGLTQWDVARRLNYSTAQFVSNWERGVSLPPMEALPNLASLYGTPGREFVEVIAEYQARQAKLELQRLVDAFKRHSREAKSKRA